MSITVADVLNANGTRREIAERLGVKRTSVNQWVSIGSIPAKFVWILSRRGGWPCDVHNPEFRALFDLVEEPPPEE